MTKQIKTKKNLESLSFPYHSCCPTNGQIEVSCTASRKCALDCLSHVCLQHALALSLLCELASPHFSRIISVLLGFLECTNPTSTRLPVWWCTPYPKPFLSTSGFIFNQFYRLSRQPIQIQIRIRDPRLHATTHEGGRLVSLGTSPPPSPPTA